MAAIEYVIPGGSVYNDRENGFEPVVPGVGIVNEQAAPPVGRTTKNTDPWNLGQRHGESFRMVT